MKNVSKSLKQLRPLRCMLAWTVLTLLSCAGPSFAQLAVPELWGQRIHDDAKVMSPGVIDQLENDLKLFEDSTSNQIAVLTIRSLEGEPVEEFALRVAEKWKLGQKENDNGVLLLVAVDDHKMRIEVGYGLEGSLTDALCSRIIRTELAPHFRRDDYDAGITAGVKAIMLAIAGEYTVDEQEIDNLIGLDVKERILIGAFVFGILGIFTVLGLFVPGCGGWALYAFLIPFYAAFPMVVLGVSGGLTVLGTYIIAFPILKLVIGATPWGKKAMKKMGSGRSGSGGWSSGSGWSSGWSSGSSSGGFSGGGGSFGGGGSSGSW